MKLYVTGASEFKVTANFFKGLFVFFGIKYDLNSLYLITGDNNGIDLCIKGFAQKFRVPLLVRSIQENQTKKMYYRNIVEEADKMLIVWDGISDDCQLVMQEMGDTSKQIFSCVLNQGHG